MANSPQISLNPQVSRIQSVPEDKYYSSDPAGPSVASQKGLPGQLPIPGIVIRDYSRGSQVYCFMPITQADYVSFNDHSIYLSHLHDLQPLPFLRKKYHCIGSHLGWLVVHEPSSYPSSLHLLNPISGAKLALPPVTSLSSSYPGGLKNSDSEPDHKSTLQAVLSFTRSSDNGSFSCYVMLLNYNKKTNVVPFCNIGYDKCWRFVESSAGKIRYQDMTCCNGRFYLVDSNGRLYTFDLEDSTFPKTTEIASSPWMEKPEGHQRNFLAEWKGDLLMISQTFQFSFQVYRLDSRVNYWYELERWGKYAIFIGCNQAMTVSTLNVKGLKRNYVYFIQKSSGQICIYKHVGSTFHSRCLCFKDVGLDGMWFMPLSWRLKDTMPNVCQRPTYMIKEVGGVSDHLLGYDDRMWFTPLSWSLKDTMPNVRERPTCMIKEVGGVSTDHLLGYDDGTSAADQYTNRKKKDKNKLRMIQKLRDFFKL